VLVEKSFADPHKASVHIVLMSYSRQSNIGKQRFLFLAVAIAMLHLANAWSQGKAFPVQARTPEPIYSGEWVAPFDGESMKGWRETLFTNRGEIRIENGSIILGAGLLTGISWVGDFPKSDFEIRFEAARLKGNDFFAGLTFPVSESFCTLIVGGWGGGTVGLSSINGWDASDNQTTSWCNFDNGKWYAIRLRVTSEQICAWIDERVVVNLALRGHVISLRNGEIKLSAPLGFASYKTTAGLRKLEFRTLTIFSSAPAR
jgi:hypothetical protein